MYVFLQRRTKAIKILQLMYGSKKYYQAIESVTKLGSF